MRTLYRFLLVAVAPLVAALPPTEGVGSMSSQNRERPEFVKKTMEAHQKTSASGKGIVSFDLEHTPKGGRTQRMHIDQRPDGSAIRLRQNNGSELIWDGKNAWASGKSDARNARFELFSWSYFFSLPWKLDDPGARWEVRSETRMIGAHACETGRLSFAPGAGDTPDDWYLIFSDKTHHLVRGAVYIVTYGGISPEEAAKRPRAISYEDYRPVDGIPIARVWNFSAWNTDEPSNGKPLAQVKIVNIQFSAERAGLFSAPAGSKKI